ncbi:MAG: hypothetical protein Q6368_009340 [Candidatus Baldrarchaeota archaeon]|nr:hypothetical protein [Candidatus Baldrarchaeota archaeon]
MSEELVLLRSIYSELKDLRKKIDKIDEELLRIKIILLKEEEIEEKEREEIEKILNESDENFISLDEFKRTFE